MQTQLKHYITITAGYWAFTVTDGAIRMLVVLHFHLLGYSPFEVAMLFLFYELFGVVTNLVGGWLGARIGLNRTMHIGMLLQIGALCMLTVPTAWLSVGYVMVAQAISGIAKDLNKMSAKASVKTIASGADGKLFKWVAALTGSKNALKGAGFFIGAALLEWVGFRVTLAVLAGSLLLVLLITLVLLPSGIGKSKAKAKFTQVFSNTPAINWLAGARFFLFGSRDVWFVVGLPVFLYETLQWSFIEVGGFLAAWVVGYGLVQTVAPKLVRASHPGGVTARLLALGLALVPAGIAMAMANQLPAQTVLIVGLMVFGVVFALNSSVHSYLILAYSDHDKVAMNVGFYYMANAAGRLAGTVLSGAIYQSQGLEGCLWWSAGMLIAAGIVSFNLPAGAHAQTHQNA
jgi:predicted MFS family arabinose efflux permease